MADPASYRPKPGEIPTRPGVYRFIDAHGRVVYVGKAKSLRSRLNSYFTSVRQLHPKTYAMVHAAASVEWTVVGSELEAIQLEYTWIKQHTPRFNIMYRDDKSYPYLAVTMNETVPRVQVMRGDKNRASNTLGRSTLPKPSGTQLTRCCAFSRSGPVRQGCTSVLKQLDVPVCSATSTNVPRHAWERSLSKITASSRRSSSR